ncbi:hypothetical protein INR49_003401 [Caranx melampygus]|nr:hypothetical protein INR49_003401 [Caranx melampygus]
MPTETRKKVELFGSFLHCFFDVTVSTEVGVQAKRHQYPQHSVFTVSSARKEAAPVHGLTLHSRYQQLLDRLHNDAQLYRGS